MPYLKDAHALEQTSLQMTDAAAKAADDPQLRELFEHHHEETQEHERLVRAHRGSRREYVHAEGHRSEGRGDWHRA
jgi:hypothetical protein